MLTAIYKTAIKLTIVIVLMCAGCAAARDADDFPVEQVLEEPAPEPHRTYQKAHPDESEPVAPSVVPPGFMGPSPTWYGDGDPPLCPTDLPWEGEGVVTWEGAEEIVGSPAVCGVCQCEHDPKHTGQAYLTMLSYADGCQYDWTAGYDLYPPGWMGTCALAAPELGHNVDSVLVQAQAVPARCLPAAYQPPAALPDPVLHGQRAKVCEGSSIPDGPGWHSCIRSETVDHCPESYPIERHWKDARHFFAHDTRFCKASFVGNGTKGCTCGDDWGKFSVKTKLFGPTPINYSDCHASPIAEITLQAEGMAGAMGCVDVPVEPKFQQSVGTWEPIGCKADGDATPDGAIDIFADDWTLCCAVDQ